MSLMTSLHTLMKLLEIRQILATRIASDEITPGQNFLAKQSTPDASSGRRSQINRQVLEIGPDSPADELL